MRFTKIILAIVLCIAVCSSLSHAGKKDEPKVESKPAKIKDVKLNLVPTVNFGVVIGEAAELIELWGGDQADKALYGGGLSLVYYPDSRLGIGLNLQRQIKVIPGNYTSSAYGWFYSSSLIYNIRPLHKAVPYARFDAGRFSASYPMNGPDLDLGTYSYMRLGIGLFVFTSGRINMRWELYYQRAFSEGRTIDALGDYDIGFMAECIAAEVGIGIPLLLR